MVLDFTSVLRLHLFPKWGDVWCGRGGHLIVLFYRNSYYSPPPPPPYNQYIILSILFLTSVYPPQTDNEIRYEMESKYSYGFGFNGKKMV